jgi:hypothetical protein
VAAQPGFVAELIEDAAAVVQLDFARLGFAFLTPDAFGQGDQPV